MKHTLSLIPLLCLCTVVMGQSKPDTTKHYTFAEPEAVTIDNLLGQLDQLSGNSDKISTSQYNAIHKAVLRIDSLIKVQYFKYHPVKGEPKKP